MSEEVKDYCVCCGSYVPEGTHICGKCRKEYTKEEPDMILHNNGSESVYLLNNRTKDNSDTL